MNSATDRVTATARGHWSAGTRCRPRSRRFGNPLNARALGAVAATIAATAALAGCGAGTGGASRTVDQFENALRADDHSAACALLAPDTREDVAQSGQPGASCADAIADEDLPDGGSLQRVDVYGRQARAVLAGDTVFLSRFPDGWRVVAAGCEPRPGHPYDCTVKGG